MATFVSNPPVHLRHTGTNQGSVLRWPSSAARALVLQQRKGGNGRVALIRCKLRTQPSTNKRHEGHMCRHRSGSNQYVYTETEPGLGNTPTQHHTSHLWRGSRLTLPPNPGPDLAVRKMFLQQKDLDDRNRAARLGLVRFPM
ncbi:hypothetical protein WMY93_028032 [Mugilogobius chulae]|uniref:Uncharacterized protein n=1 Tax=Mugilogobius chulae TaxID=88201 RepID=A0AAW0N1D8_9GOBI